MKVSIDIKLILRILAVLVLAVLCWYFSSIVLYLFLAFIFSLIGKPIAASIHKIKFFKRYYIPYGISSLITILVFLSILMLVLLFFIPVLAREARNIANIDYDVLAVNLGFLLDNIQNFLYTNGFIGENETLVGLITHEIKQLINLTSFSNILGSVVSITGSFFFGLFAVFFLTFFFIKDDIRIDGVAHVLFGKRYAVRITYISQKINNLLSRYFIGLLLEIVSMITILYIGMAIFGIKGALLLACFGGILNAIPYLGPLIGAIFACIFGTIDCISINDYYAILPTVFKIAGTFIGANLIDNIVLQPVIYSQSVKTHPIEIFLVSIMGGSLAGILGMLFAIPVYTIIRTIIIELFNYINEVPRR